VISHVTVTGARNPLLVISALNDYPLFFQLMENTNETVHRRFWYNIPSSIVAYPGTKGEFTAEKSSVKQPSAREKIQAETRHGIKK
jgi:hypothetical protein